MYSKLCFSQKVSLCVETRIFHTRSTRPARNYLQVHPKRCIPILTVPTWSYPYPSMCLCERTCVHLYIHVSVLYDNIYTVYKQLSHYPKVMTTLKKKKWYNKCKWQAVSYFILSSISTSNFLFGFLKQIDPLTKSFPPGHTHKKR